MTEDSPTLQAYQSDHLKDMLEKSAGWKAVRGIIDEMRREAFGEWAALRLDAKTEDVLSIRATEKVLARLLERIDEAIKRGDEARVSMAEGEAAAQQEIRFREEKLTPDSEIEALRAPLEQTWWSKLSEAITPQGAAPH